MSSIMSFIKGHVQLSLREAKTKKAKLTGMKSSDLGSTIQKYQKMLHQMSEEAQELQEKMDRLKSMFVEAAESKGKVIDQIADAISVLRDTKEQAARASALLVQMKQDFGDNKASASLMEEANKFKAKMAALVKEREEFLNGLAKKQVPRQLTTNDERFFKPFIVWVFRDLQKAGNGATINTKESIFLPGINDSRKKEIRWARFMPLTNVPTIEGKKRNLYLVVCITFLAYGEAKGRITPLTITDKRGMEKPAISEYSVGLVGSVMDPFKLSPVLKVAASVQDAINILAYLSEKEGLSVFGEELEGEPEERMKKHEGKFHVLDKEGVIVEKDKKGRNFILVKVPQEMAETNANQRGGYKIPQTPSKFDADLYVDVSRYAGLPSNSPYNTGRLRLEKVYAKGEYICFLFRVVPVGDADIHSDVIKQPKKETPVLDSSFDDGGFDLGGLNEIGVNDMVNDWLGKNNSW